MPDPIKLAQQYHDELIAAGLQQRVEQQLAEDNAELPTFWQGLGTDGQHVIQRLGSDPVEIGTSLTSGGLVPGQRVDAAFSEGFVAIDHTPFIATEETSTTQVIRKPNIQLLFAKYDPLNPANTYTSVGGIVTWPGGYRVTLYLKINNRPIIEIGQLVPKSQNLIFDRNYSNDNQPAYENTSITPSGFDLRNYILFDQNTTIIQVDEEWEVARSDWTDFDDNYKFEVRHIIHTFVIRSNSATHYKSEEMILTFNSPIEVLFVYPAALSPYQNYLIAGIESQYRVMPFGSFIPIAVLGETEDNPGIRNDRVRYFYKFRQLWVQVLSTAGTLLNASNDPGWNYFFTNQKYQVATQSTINSNRIDTTYPGFQALKISASDLQTMAALQLDSIIYEDEFQNSPILGVVADAVIPTSPFNTSYSDRNTFYYGEDGQEKSWLRFEGVRGIPEVY